MKKSLIFVLICCALVLPVSAEGQKENKDKIELFSHKRETVSLMNEIIAGFNEEYPGIGIELVVVPDSDQVLMSRVASNDVPDIYSELPLNPTYQTLSAEGYNYDLSGQSFLKNINQGILDSTKVNGKAYCLPVSLNYTGVYYNKEIFESQNLEVPETYEDLISACRNLEESGIQAVMVSDRDVWTIGAFADRAMGLIFDDKGELFKAVGRGDQSVGDSDGFIEMLDQILEVREYAGEDTLGIGYDQAAADFANGTAAMMYQGSWFLSMLKKANPDIDLGVFPYPALKKEDTRVGINIDYALMLSAENSQVESSLKFLEYFSRTEVGQLYSDKDGSPSAINGVVNKTEEYADVESLVTEGKTFRISRTYWEPGVIQELQSNLQMFIMDRDKNAFITEMDNSIKSYYQK